MGKVRYFKFVAANGEERLIRYSNNQTEGFISNRWMIEPSLLLKLNGRDPDPTVMEISFKEAKKIAGIKNTSIFSNVFSNIILIGIFFICGVVSILAYNIVKRNFNEKQQSENKTIEQLIEEKIEIGENEKDVIKEFSKEKINDLYSLIPFSGNSIKHAYQKDNNNIGTIDATTLYSVAVAYCNKNENKCNKGTSTLNDYKSTYSITGLKGIIASIYNGYDGYNVLSFPNEFVSSDNKTYCLLSDSRDYYNCKENTTLMKTYRLYNIVKITEDEENLYLYESSVLVKNEYQQNDKYYFKVYRYSNEKGIIVSCDDQASCLTSENTYEKYANSSVIYKHTFKKVNNGYYWYSTDYNSKL